jgi:hypothetical protein
MHHFPDMTTAERVSVFPYFDTVVNRDFIIPAKRMGYSHDDFETEDIGTKEALRWNIHGETRGGSKYTVSIIWHLTSPTVKEDYTEVEVRIPGSPKRTRKLDKTNPSESFLKILEEYKHV